MNKPALTLAALLQSCQVGCQTEIPQSGLELPAHGDACVWEAEPDSTFLTSGFVGVSASIECPKDAQYVVAHPQRMYITFLGPDEKLGVGLRDFFNINYRTITDASLHLDVTSGTCRTSFNNQQCNKPIGVEVYAVLQPWDEGTLTWNTQPKVSSWPVGKFEIQEDVDNQGHQYNVELPGFPVVLEENKGAVYGLMLRADGNGEFELENALIGGQIAPQRRDELSGYVAQRQADVNIGTTETGLPAKLTIAHR